VEVRSGRQRSLAGSSTAAFTRAFTRSQVLSRGDLLRAPVAQGKLVLSEVEGSAPACRLQVRALRPFACRGRFPKPPSLRRAGNTSRIIPSLQYTCAAERTGKLPRGGFGGSIHPWYSSARGLLTKSNCFWRGCPFCQSATRHRPQPISFSIHHLRSAFR
jgi:hypothetical protein